MTVSPQWNELYRSNRHLSIWPWTDMVSYVHRFAHPKDGFARVLELGCGAGANIPLFLQLNMDYWSVEGSPVIVEKIRAAYPQMKNKIVVGDFTTEIPFAGEFDLVVDRAALIHNDTPAIQRALALVFGRLRSGGKFIGIDWFANDHGYAKAGEALDGHTRTNIQTGPMAGVGAVHFCDRGHLTELLEAAGFGLEQLEHKSNVVVLPAGGDRLATWNFAAVKP